MIHGVGVKSCRGSSLNTQSDAMLQGSNQTVNVEGRDRIDSKGWRLNEREMGVGAKRERERQNTFNFSPITSVWRNIVSPGKSKVHSCWNPFTLLKQTPHQQHTNCTQQRDSGVQGVPPAEEVSPDNLKRSCWGFY